MRKDIIGRYGRKVYMNVCLILIGYRDTAVWVYRRNLVRFLFVGLVKGEVYKRQVDAREELIARILDAAVLIKKPEVQLRQKTRDLRTRVAKRIEVDGGIFEN